MAMGAGQRVNGWQKEGPGGRGKVRKVREGGEGKEAKTREGEEGGFVCRTAAVVGRGDGCCDWVWTMRRYLCFFLSR